MLVALVGLAISAGVAQAQTKIENVPIKATAKIKIDGKQMFDSYCAVCHGKDGKGAGPAAKALVKPPADLTQLSARNSGTFPEIRVERFIEGADEVPAHGTRDMPMWGELFRSLNKDTAKLRVSALADHLKTMQQ
jgi:mono/diheme cytochrome c family protein